MENESSICPKCKLKQSCPGEPGNLCLYCLEKTKFDVFGWDGIISLLGFLLWIYLRFVCNFKLGFVVLVVSIFGPFFLFNKYFREKHYNYIYRTSKKEPSTLFRKPYYIVTLVLFIALLFSQPNIYYYFIPQDELTIALMNNHNKSQEENIKKQKENKKSQEEYKKIQIEYEKTHDFNDLQKFVDKNKNAIKMLSNILIENKDPTLVSKYNEINKIAILSRNNISSQDLNEYYRLTDKFILIFREQSPNIPDPKDEDNSMFALFSGLQPTEILNVVEKQKSIVYIVKSFDFAFSYNIKLSNLVLNAKGGDAYRWKYLVYVIDLKNMKTIAYKEFLGNMPPEQTSKNSTDAQFRMYGTPPNIGDIDSWYFKLPLK